MPRFSHRLPENLAPSPASQAIARKRQDGKGLIDLTESNPTRVGLCYPEAPILQAIADPRSVSYAPDPAGRLDAREAIGRRLQVPVEDVFLTASSSESYAWLFQMLADPGDQILVPAPSYPLFEFLANLQSVQVCPYPLRYDDGWFIDMERLRQSITPRTRALVWVNPNNPTGSFLRRGQLAELISLCRKHDLAIISDEVFSEYPVNPLPDAVRTLHGASEILTFCLSGLSKLAGLPQMKLGWIILSGDPSEKAQTRALLEVIADTYLSVGTPVQCALPLLLKHGELVRQQISIRALRNLNALNSCLKIAPECSLLRVEGGWTAVLKMPLVRNEEQWVQYLLEADVLVQPGYYFDFHEEAFVVVSLLTEPEIFRCGAQLIAESVKASLSAV